MRVVRIVITLFRGFAAAALSRCASYLDAKEAFTIRE